MCAGTVVEAPTDTSAASVSVTSRSRSVALRLSLAFSPRISTLPRMGMVLRRSTTRWTWPSDFRSCARSTVTFMTLLAPYHPVMIHVCSLAKLPETVEATGARHVITVMGRVDRVTRPASIRPDNHLLVSMDDIIAPAEGFNPPNAEHVPELIAFTRRWDRAA